MKKPHEQTWRIRNTNIGPVIDDTSVHPEGNAVCMVYAPFPADGRRMPLDASEVIQNERARFIAGAPAMARALLTLSQHPSRTRYKRGDGHACVFCLARFVETHTHECPTRMAREALREAGVLP